jgi:chloramphenicol-sensitive protein RarD
VARRAQFRHPPALIFRAISSAAVTAQPAPSLDTGADARRARTGFAYAAGAFFLWGLAPLYFTALHQVPPLEIIAHRVIWSVVFLVTLLAVSRGFEDLRAVLRQPRTLAILALTSGLIAINWLTFVWAVSVGRLLDTSLGYFMTPQVNVLLGLLFLKERLRRVQWIALLLAAVGVLIQVWMLGQLPWIALVLAASFGCYGLFRKQVQVDPVTGLLVETLAASPLALAYLLHLQRVGTLRFAHNGRTTDILLVLLGVVTAVPLMMFTAGAQRLRLTTVGFMQYLAPSMTFVIAIVFYGEPFVLAKVLTFVFIWAGILIYAADTWRTRI